MDSEGVSRREFVVRAAALTAGAAFLTPALSGLAACSDAVGPLPRAAGYGPLARSAQVPELWIPQEFSVRKLSTALGPSLVDPGWTVPYGLDGMAAFALPNGNVRLVRNHEIRDLPGAAELLDDAAPAYDRRAGGGTSSLEVAQHGDGSVQLVAEFVSLNGTLSNCAGGGTPWGSWISCEETTAGPQAGYEAEHGYCFEVAADAHEAVEAVPLRAMGRFTHEAVAVDPRSGIVYLTEDMAYAPELAQDRGSGFYRFIPNDPGRLSNGGRLQMLAIAHSPQYVTAVGQSVGQTLPVIWLDIDDPDPAGAEQNPSAVFQQGWRQGGAVFHRLEGCWYGQGNVYFNATSGGDAQAGQVWAFRPLTEAAGELSLLFESPSRDVLDSPDNLCVSPRGGLVICEDGVDVQFIRGLTSDGLLFDFVRTHEESAEFAGACFSPDGRTLFFNIQGGTTRADAPHLPGGTYAVWGPWRNGPL